MAKLTKKLIVLAYEVDKFLGGRVETLYKQKVVGTKKEKDTQQLVKFLIDNNIEFEQKPNVIWLSNIEKGVAHILNKYK